MLTFCFTFWFMYLLNKVHVPIFLVLVCAVMYTFAIQYARRKVFNLFWFTHNMYIIYYTLMIFHGSGRLVQPPFLWFFLLGPAILFTLDKLVSISRKKAEITVVKAELLPSGISFAPGGLLIFELDRGVPLEPQTLPIFKDDFGRKGYPFLRIFLEK